LIELDWLAVMATKVYRTTASVSVNRSGGSSSLGTSDTTVSWEFFNVEELQAIIRVRVAVRGTGDQHGDRTAQLMIVQPGPGKIAPALRFFDQLHRLDAT
jgi:hypothetical protein